MASAQTIRQCQIDSCEKPVRARGWCQGHYERWRVTGDPLSHRPPRSENCIVKDCDRVPKAHGWCEKHYYLLGKRVWTCEVPGCAAESTTRICSTHRSRMARYGSYELPPGVRAGRHEHSDGYVVVRKPGHPMAQPTKGVWVYEHRAILFEAIGDGEHSCHWCQRPVSWTVTHPAPGALVVDHLDENRANNSVANLVPSCGPCNSNRSRKRTA